MNEYELNLSKLSYINKDFASIYPDLLDLVKTLTNRWDPSTSNESDPGVVLLKVGAFLADHLNYNIDKNILECFLPSATQEESVRRIAEFGGYVPKYYRSAEGYVTLTYNPTTFENSFQIPPFTLVISNNDGSITYTQLESISINEKNVASLPAKFIEGTIQRLSIDSDIISLDNLDDNRRIYFPNSYVAENGIFVYNVVNGLRASEEWKHTDYIYTQPLGTKCYKIDYDSSKNLPYLEFPTDIANLIGDGLAIYYIYTAGSYGNVRAGELNTIVSVDTQSLKSDAAKKAFEKISDFTVTNSAAITNGTEPESIEEIKRSYRKVVGTFDTLVSTQDYSNAIRTVEAEDGTPYISNGLVTDRRIDYNNSINVIATRSTGTYFKNIAFAKFGNLIFKGYIDKDDPTLTPENGWVCTDTTDNLTYVYIDGEWKLINSLATNELSDLMNNMSPYDLIIYALQKYSENDYNSVYYWQALKNSFNQIGGTADINDTNFGTEDDLINSINNLKCINHTFKDLETGQIYCFKNYVPLNVDIIPYNKVSKYERFEILNNIRKAISNRFNASGVEFGEELNYDEVKRVIEEADSRINYVRLSDFEYSTKVMLKDPDIMHAPEENLNDDHMFGGYECSYIVDMAAKNVMAGRLCLFNFDDSFDYKLGQKDCEIYPDIVSVKTKLTIKSLGGNSYDYTLDENEVVEILYPNYYSDITYGSYVLYNLTLDDPDKVITANTEYTLQPGEELKIYYKNENGVGTPVSYSEGTIIRSSFNLRNFSTSLPVFKKETIEYNQLASNESISIRVLLNTVFNSPTNVYWIMNNTGNILFKNGESEKILDQGEFFIYTDSTKTYLTIFGRGTKLNLNSPADRDWTITTSASNKISQQQLSEDGLAAKIPFISWSDFSINNMTATEMNIIALGEGSRIELIGTEPEITYNIQFADNIKYTLPNGNEVTLPNQANFYLIRSRLDLNLNKTPMRLWDIANDKTQEIEISYEDGTQVITGTNTGLYIQSSTDMSLIGSTSNEGIDISMYNDLGIDINWITYNIAEQTITGIRPTDQLVVAGYTGWACSSDRGTFENITTPVPAGDVRIGTYYICDELNDSTEEIDYSPSLDMINYIIKIPFSVVWYDYLSDPDAPSDLDREYILPIYLSNPNDDIDKVKVSFSDDLGNQIELGYYGNIDTDGTNYYLLPNQMTYIYPIITTETQKNIILTIEGNQITSGYLTITDPSVIWGGALGLGGSKGQVVDRINNLLKNSTDNTLQFNWINIPNSDLAMNITDLNDPYSLFDHNNVANIITIPVVDLENSNIDIIRAMRNY